MNDVIAKVIVSSPLIYGANTSINNFGGLQNSNLALLDFALVTSNITAATANSVPTLNFANTAVANIFISSPNSVTQTINLASFPQLGYSEMAIQVMASVVPQFLNFANIVPNGVITVAGNNGFAGYNTTTANFAITSAMTPYEIKIGSTDGTNFVLDSLTTAVAKSYTPSSNVGTFGDTAGMIAYDSSYIYVCTGNYDGSTIIWKKAAIA